MHKHNDDSPLCLIFLISQWPSISPWKLIKNQKASLQTALGQMPLYTMHRERLPSTRVLTELCFCKWQSPCPACTWVSMCLPQSLK